ncbi:MAG: hypothetical protein AVDCRST_MAG88-2702, partial [uncultured Thermomicrobiales bacterium]
DEIGRPCRYPRQPAGARGGAGRPRPRPAPGRSPNRRRRSDQLGALLGAGRRARAGRGVGRHPRQPRIPAARLRHAARPGRLGRPGRLPNPALAPPTAGRAAPGAHRGLARLAQHSPSRRAPAARRPRLA